MNAAARPPCPRAGFTLIEVLVALAIFTLGVAALAGAFSNAMLALTGLEDESDVENELRFVRRQVIQIKELEELEKGGMVKVPNLGDVDWTAVVEPAAVADLFTVTLTFAAAPRTFDGERREWTQRLFLLRPGWSDPADRSTLMNDRKNALDRERAGRVW